MRIIRLILLLTAVFSINLSAQTSASAPSIPAKVPVDRTARPKPANTALKGKIYTNKTYNFEIKFPADWTIPENYLNENVEQSGYNLQTKNPSDGISKKTPKLVEDIDRVKILLTAYSSSPVQANRAVVRVSVEDLSPLPQIADAVDYFDAMRQSFLSMKLPADFKFSETQAEKLGKKQFAFLDTSSNAGKKRLYATVRGGYAIMLTLTYKKDEDLQTFRDILAEGNFALDK